MLSRLIAIGVVIFISGANSVPGGRFEHAKIDLDVIAANDHKTAHMDQTPPNWGKNPRPVVKAQVGEAIKLKYMLTNVYPNKTIADVVVHFYVVRIGAVGQRDIPSLEGDALVFETAHDLDMRPGGHTGGRSSVRIDTPGVYLVRVETRNTQSDHEHFSAIDLLVEDK